MTISRQQGSPLFRPAPAWSEPKEGLELLDQSNMCLGIGRSANFHFPQWRDNDPLRTVFFDEGRGFPIVFVHGLGANATHWEHLVNGLVGKYRVLGLDMAGCGWNLKPRMEYTVDFLTDHLMDFLDRRGIEKCVLVGHSLGGMICLGATLRQPERVEGLGLVGAAGVAPLPRWMKVAGPIFLREDLLFKTLSLGAEFILKNVFVDGPEENPLVKAFFKSSMRDAPGYPNLRDFARVCASLCRDVVCRDFSERLHELDVPVLGLWGEADKLTPIPSILKNLGKIPRVRTVILKGCGHMPMVEKPFETLYHVQRFIEAPPAVAGRPLSQERPSALFRKQVKRILHS